MKLTWFWRVVLVRGHAGQVPLQLLPILHQVGEGDSMGRGRRTRQQDVQPSIFPAEDQTNKKKLSTLI